MAIDDDDAWKEEEIQRKAIERKMLDAFREFGEWLFSLDGEKLYKIEIERHRITGKTDIGFASEKEGRNIYWHEEF